MKKYIIIIISAVAVLSACNPHDVMENQAITFTSIPTASLGEGKMELKASSTSGLTVAFLSNDTSIATIEGNEAILHKVGNAKITAYQDGDDLYYEAPMITQQLKVRDWDPNKKSQTIQFVVDSVWRESTQGTIIYLKAIASSGLTVSYTFDGPNCGQLLGSKMFLYHGGEVKAFPTYYECDITITASQEGDDKYNAADNVSRKVHIVGDVLHN